jgi:hypothetical protein
MNLALTRGRRTQNHIFRLVVLFSMTIAILLGTADGLGQAPSEGALFGITFVPNVGGTGLVTINPTTGAQSLVGSLPTASSQFTVSTLDSAGHRYFFVGADAGSQTRLFVVNTQTGALLAQPTLNLGATSIEFAAPMIIVPKTKEDCKSGGWQILRRADGSSFKNQGDCVSYVETGK